MVSLSGGEVFRLAKWNHRVVSETTPSLPFSEFPYLFGHIRIEPFGVVGNRPLVNR